MAANSDRSSVRREKAFLDVTVRRRLTAGLILLGVALIMALLALWQAGFGLVVDDSLQRGHAVVVLGGQLPFRAKEAARIYEQGWAQEVWLTRGRPTEEDEALAQIGISHPSDSDYSRLVLERLGVPGRAIRLLPAPAANTADEVRIVAEALNAASADRVIIVTSKYHTRRVKALWQKLVGAHPAAVVRYTPDDPFDPGHWWRTTTDSMAVSREWFGILNAWAGFPVSSER